MYTTEEVQNIIEQFLSEENWSINPSGLYEPIAYILSLGGKRIRPALLLMSTNLFTDDINQSIKTAIGIEVFHNFTLLHDDIMDKAPVRRRKPTVHTKWNENTAILSGDAMLIKAYQYLADLPPDKLPACLEQFSQTALEVCEGQQYDMDFETRNDVSVDEYLHMIRLKTAVLLGASLKIGALIGGANKEDVELLYNFGINIGLAFQLKDDLLDVYGNPDSFGKQIGGDIVSNKKTFLLISALNKTDTKSKKILNDWLKKENCNPKEKVKAIKSIYDEIDVKALCEEKMDSYFKKALLSLDKVSVPLDRKKILSNIANQLMSREA